ncbi:MAG TPA: single-stranded-DNA-specific exonuclease RecJ [Gemmatimonadaceae bacterium]|nr:single-stranded-DNA-specific exonuclease RecJ [Gemmatimonadaceae bacterium]
MSTLATESSAPATSERAVRPAHWILPTPPDEEAVRALAEALSLPEIVCRLLLIRGYVSAEDAKLFLRPRLDRLHDPLSFLTMDKAVERLARAVKNQELVFVHGDYDVDGICSTTILVRTIRQLGGKATPFIPRRIEDGYDLSDAGVDAAIEAGAKVVVTCDCGTGAVSPVARLCRAGIDVIVTDHHLPSGDLPDCLSVLNPKRSGCGYPDKDLAAVGVTFKLSLALARALGANENFIWAMLDLVALATVADVAPLRGENRVFVRFGLKMLRETRNIGMRALLRASGLENRQLTAGRIGFILAPRLNAAGRLGHAIRGVELLLTENEHEANVIARELEELNQRRQEIDRATLEQARERVLAMDLDEQFSIVLADDSWHPGVVGIVASRLVEEFGRPTVLIALSGEQGKGSGRSIPKFDLHGALGKTREHLIRYGGHRAAAGVTIARDKVDDFAARFNEIAKTMLSPADLVPEIRVDLEVDINGLDGRIESLFRHFEPFGIGNPTPVLLARNVTIARPPRVVGEHGLKVVLDTGTGSLDALGWGLAERAAEFQPGAKVDVAFRLERDDYRGESYLQARIADIRLSEA